MRAYRFVSHNEKAGTIDIETGVCGIYAVDLDRCKTSSQCLDWIHQLHVKTWFDGERMQEFIDMLFQLIPTELWSGA